MRRPYQWRISSTGVLPVQAMVQTHAHTATHTYSHTHTRTHTQSRTQTNTRGKASSPTRERPFFVNLLHRHCQVVFPGRTCLCVLGLVQGTFFFMPIKVLAHFRPFHVPLFVMSGHALHVSLFPVCFCYSLPERTCEHTTECRMIMRNFPAKN